MDQFLEWWNWLWQQAYIYVPTLMAVISAIGIPCIVSLGKIVADTTLVQAKFKEIFNWIKDTTDKFNAVVDVLDSEADEDIAYYTSLLEDEWNEDKKALYQQRIESLNARKEAHKNLRALLIEEPVKKIKAKVKKGE